MSESAGFEPGTHVMWQRTRYFVIRDDGACHDGQPKNCKNLEHRPLHVYELKNKRGQWVLRYHTTMCIPGDRVTVCEDQPDANPDSIKARESVIQRGL